MSRFDRYDSSATFTTQGTISTTDPYGARTGQTTSTVTCWTKQERKEHRQADGTFATSTLTLGVPAGTVIPDGVTVTVATKPYRVIRWVQELDAFNVEEGRIVYLGV